MKTGRLQETIYNRSILKELHGSQNDKYQRAGAGAGSTVLRLGFVEKQIVTMSSIGYARKNIGKLGIIAAANAIALAKADERIAAEIAGKTVIKELYIPKKLVNIVVK